MRENCTYRLSGGRRPAPAGRASSDPTAGSPAKARTTDRVSRTATLMRTKRQNIQLELALEPAAKGEARSAGAQGTEARTARAEPERPATPSNRRVRPRTHGGVGGEEPRGSPLSRLRYGPAGDAPSVPRLRWQLWALRAGLDGASRPATTPHGTRQTAGFRMARRTGTGWSRRQTAATSRRAWLRVERMVSRARGLREGDGGPPGAGGRPCCSPQTHTNAE